MLDKYNEIWDVIKNKLGIKFHSEPIYDKKYIKAKVREFISVIKTTFWVIKCQKKICVILALLAWRLILLREWIKVRVRAKVRIRTWHWINGKTKIWFWFWLWMRHFTLLIYFFDNYFRFINNFRFTNYFWHGNYFRFSNYWWFIKNYYVLIMYLVVITRALFSKDFNVLLDILFGVFRHFFKLLGIIFLIIPDFIWFIFSFITFFTMGNKLVIRFLIFCLNTTLLCVWIFILIYWENNNNNNNNKKIIIISDVKNI